MKIIDEETNKKKLSISKTIDAEKISCKIQNPYEKSCITCELSEQKSKRSTSFFIKPFLELIYCIIFIIEVCKLKFNNQKRKNDYSFNTKNKPSFNSDSQLKLKVPKNNLM